MTNQPLVTIICLCYNHERFIEEAVLSVINQTYKSTQIILIDDDSSDQSQSVINKLVGQFPQIETILLSQNLGNCKAFNLALAKAKGEYIIDFATDDILLPDRISRQIACFQKLDNNYGVVFGDCQFISEEGEILHTHYKRDTDGKLLESIPSGNIYQEILSRYFISTPTMMIRKSVLDELNGYDESLNYEDFDFWVRSSRNWLYHYQDQILTQKRIVEGSLSTQFYQKGENKLLASTLVVCQKAFELNRNSEDNQSLAKCIRYHLRQSLFVSDFALVLRYYDLLKKISTPDKVSRIFVFLANNKISLGSFHSLYFKFIKS